ncbi:DUF6087 family protein [Streptomyces roseifaciens]
MNPTGPTGPNDPADEPLEVWAARRERRRAAYLRKTGHRRAEVLADGPRGSHVNPGAPRLLLEWDGYAWATVGVADNADEARQFLRSDPPPAPPEKAAGGRRPWLGQGKGRHRKAP